VSEGAGTGTDTFCAACERGLLIMIGMSPVPVAVLESREYVNKRQDIGGRWTNVPRRLAGVQALTFRGHNDRIRLKQASALVGSGTGIICM
jgi:hypothetical protein